MLYKSTKKIHPTAKCGGDRCRTFDKDLGFKAAVLVTLDGESHPLRTMQVQLLVLGSAIFQRPVSHPESRGESISKPRCERLQEARFTKINIKVDLIRIDLGCRPPEFFSLWVRRSECFQVLWVSRHEPDDKCRGVLRCYSGHGG